MKVSKAIETPEGTVKFEGELEAVELDYVLKVGLNLLLIQGAIATSKPAENVVEGTDTIQ